MDDDSAERLAALRDRVDSMAQELEAVRARTADADGKDSTGYVRATVAASGQVREVSVRPGWRAHLNAASLASAVREAVEKADLARIRAWGEAFTEQEKLSSPKPRPAQATHESFAYRFQEAATAGQDGSRLRPALQELLAMAEAVERSIDEVSAQLRTQAKTGLTGRSRRGHVSVTITAAGSLTDVKFEQRWLAGAHELNISLETTDAFQAAYRRAVERTPNPLGEIQALARDPLELARRLHLRDD